jgi:hypothetical protein
MHSVPLSFLDALAMKKRKSVVALKEYGQDTALPFVARIARKLAMMTCLRRHLANRSQIEGVLVSMDKKIAGQLLNRIIQDSV